MNERIQGINAQLAAIASQQAPLSAAIQRQVDRKAANSADFAVKMAARDTAAEPLTAALKAEAMGTGTSAQVDAIRAAINVADGELSVARLKMDRDAAEIEPLVASLQSEIEAIGAQAAPLHAQLREAQIEALRAYRDSVAVRCDGQAAQLCELRVQALAVDNYLAQLGATPTDSNFQAGAFCLPTVRSNQVTRHSDLIPKIIVETAKLRDQWGIASPATPNDGLPWGLRAGY
jgi:hypothetical protein